MCDIEKSYFVTNEHYIPISSQPNEGYSYSEAIKRAMREIAECIYLFGGEADHYAVDTHIMHMNDDGRCEIIREADCDILKSCTESDYIANYIDTYEGGCGDLQEYFNTLCNGFA